jgi:hypothetical protein
VSIELVAIQSYTDGLNAPRGDGMKRGIFKRSILMGIGYSFGFFWSIWLMHIYLAPDEKPNGDLSALDIIALGIAMIGAMLFLMAQFLMFELDFIRRHRNARLLEAGILVCVGMLFPILFFSATGQTESFYSSDGLWLNSLCASFVAAIVATALSLREDQG